MDTVRNTLLAGIFMSLGIVASAQADEITYFGDFFDFFSGHTSDSSEPITSDGFFDSALIEGIAKFDPSLGTLTDIEVTIDPTKPIMAFIEGLVTVEQDMEAFEFFGGADTFGDYGVYYETSSSLHSVFVELYDVATDCGGGPMDGGCDGGASSSGVSELSGTTSIFDIADLADFVGVGETVDTLFVGIFGELVASFGGDNVSFITFELFYDLFAEGSGIDDEVVAVTYTYSPIPLPAPFLLLAPALVLLSVSRRIR